MLLISNLYNFVEIIIMEAEEIQIAVVSAWSRDTFEGDLVKITRNIWAKDLIDIKYSTAVDDKGQINFSALVIAKHPA